LPYSIDTVKEDLIKWFHGILSSPFGEDWSNSGIENSPFFEDYARIGSYLSDPNQYRYGLQQLHADMQKRFDTQLDNLLAQPVLRDLYPTWRRGFGQYLTGVYRNLDRAAKKRVDRNKISVEAIAIHAFRKILTDSLTANELNNGFHAGQIDNKVDILIGSPTGNEFNSFLRGKQLFKDLNAGKEHGENSHRIQWYLISKLGTLANPVTDIYASLPTWKTAKIGPRPFFLWEYLVDADGVPSNAAIVPFKTEEQSDFRAPSNLNRWLKDGKEPHLDLLTAVLSERWERRQAFTADVYLAKKMRLNWDELPTEMQEELNKSVLLKSELPPGTLTAHGPHRILRR
jgi:hypothetical protein